MHSSEEDQEPTELIEKSNHRQAARKTSTRKIQDKKASAPPEQIISLIKMPTPQASEIDELQDLPHPSLELGEDRTEISALDRQIDNLLDKNQEEQGPGIVSDQLSSNATAKRSNRLIRLERVDSSCQESSYDKSERLMASADLTQRKLMAYAGQTPPLPNDFLTENQSSVGESISVTVTMNMAASNKIKQKAKSQLARTKAYSIASLQILLIATTAFSTYIYGRAAAFMPLLTDKEAEQLSEISLWLELFFLCDFLFLICRRGLKSKKEIRLQSLIRQRILQYGPEAIALLPVHQVLSLFTDSQQRRVVDLLKLLRVHRGMLVLSEFQVRKTRRFHLPYKLAKAILVLFVLAYISGVTWCCVSSIFEEDLLTLGRSLGEPHLKSGATRSLLQVLYFSMTTLSTVGLGDLHPVTSLERALAVFLLLSSILLTSWYVSTVLSGIKQEPIRSNHRSLSEFLGHLSNLNNGKAFSQSEAVAAFLKERENEKVNLELGPMRLQYLALDLQFTLLQGGSRSDFFENFQRIFEVGDLKLLRFAKQAGVDQPRVMMKLKDRAQSLKAFVIDLVGELEAMPIAVDEDLQKIDERVSSIVFVAKAELEVSFNFRKFLFHLSKSTLPSLGTQVGLMLGHLDELFQRNSTESSRRQKITAPFAVGLFELMFGIPSQFRFKFLSHKTPFSYFVREIAWKRVWLKHNQDGDHDIQKFKEGVLRSYTESVFLPMRDKQSALLRRTASKSDQEVKQVLSMLKAGADMEGTQLQDVRTLDQAVEAIRSFTLKASLPARLEPVTPNGEDQTRERSPLSLAKEADRKYEGIISSVAELLSRIEQLEDLLEEAKAREEDLLKALSKEKDSAKREMEVLKESLDRKIQESEQLLSKEITSNQSLVKVRKALIEENAKLISQNRKYGSLLQKMKRKATLQRAPSNQPEQIQGVRPPTDRRVTQGITQGLISNLEGLEEAPNEGEMESPSAAKKNRLLQETVHRAGLDANTFQGILSKKPAQQSAFAPKKTLGGQSDQVRTFISNDFPREILQLNSVDNDEEQTFSAVLQMTRAQASKGATIEIDEKPPTTRETFGLPAIMPPSTATQIIKLNTIEDESEESPKRSSTVPAFSSLQGLQGLKPNSRNEEESHITEELSHFDRMQSRGLPDFLQNSELHREETINEEIDFGTESDSRGQSQSQSQFSVVRKTVEEASDSSGDIQIMIQSSSSVPKKKQ